MSNPSSNSGSGGESGTQHPHHAGKTSQVEVHYPNLPNDMTARKTRSHISLASIASRDQNIFVPMSFDDDSNPEGRFNYTERAQGEEYDAKRDVVRGYVKTGPNSGYRIVENLKTGVVVHHFDPPNTIHPPGTDLGPAFETDDSHTKACQEKSRIVENQGLCFCPFGTPSSMVGK